MPNAIQDRVRSYLKQIPPFFYLEEEDITQLTEAITVSYREKEELLFSEKEKPHEQVYLLRDGGLLLQEEGQMTDRLEPGEMAGIRSMLTGQPYKATAKVEEPCLLYEIPLDVFKPMAEKNSRVMEYFAKNLASGPVLSPLEKSMLHEGPAIPFIGIPLSGTQPVIEAKGEELLFDAAQRMDTHKISALLITNASKHPIGILTDVDLRRWVALGPERSPNPLVSEFMSSPVICTKPLVQAHEALKIMLERKVKHLAITQSGKEDSVLLAILTRQDVLMAQGWNPFGLIQDIQRANSPELLARLRDSAEKLAFDWLEADYPLSLISTFLTAINDQLIHQAIDMAFEKTGKNRSSYRFCWLSLGSEGRKEQVLRTDQDNALIFDPENCPVNAKKDLLRIAAEVNDTLAQCGFVYCPAEMMARNPEWCLSLSDWKKKFRHWIEQPDAQALRFTTIFFDFRPVGGDHSLARELAQHIRDVLLREHRFLSFLAKDAVEAPLPLGFFKNFVLEKSGQGETRFDIKSRAMLPLVDAARVLALHHQFLDSPNTVDRLRYAAEQDHQNASLLEDAAKAYEVFLKIRAQSGRKQGDQGRYIPIDSMSKLEKQTLRAAFRPSSSLQQILRIRFSTQLIG